MEQQDYDRFLAHVALWEQDELLQQDQLDLYYIMYQLAIDMAALKKDTALVQLYTDKREEVMSQALVKNDVLIETEQTIMDTNYMPHMVAFDELRQRCEEQIEQQQLRNYTLTIFHIVGDILTEHERQQVMIRLHEAMLRLDYHQSQWAQRLVKEVALYFVEAETPIFNHERMMMNIVPAFFLEECIKERRLEKLKNFTMNEMHKAFWISAYYCNACIDIYDEALQTISVQDQQLILEYDRVDTAILFSKPFLTGDTYPKELIHAQTRLLREVQLRWHTADNYSQLFMHLSKLAESYQFAEKDVLQYLALDTFFSPTTS
ncbi:hypothetical protein [Caryophanon tenue]|uniref:Uncharacterized protein n=1 Tax=Caryophanon tenue TaxID=33978 RepID=A0A1C0YIU2_9BACL|nr:hypothetical protein [Caryophanon tenue]OCS87090.1 hypothetical protein A6M13_11480 [Caryophanon tenue]